MRLNQKYYSLVFGVLVATIISFFMSLVLTLVNVGYGPHFPEIWLRAYAISFSVSLPISLALIPLIKKLLDRLTDSDNR